MLRLSSSFPLSCFVDSALDCRESSGGEGPVAGAVRRRWWSARDVDGPGAELSLPLSLVGGGGGGRWLRAREDDDSDDDAALASVDDRRGRSAAPRMVAVESSLESRSRTLPRGTPWSVLAPGELDRLASRTVSRVEGLPREAAETEGVRDPGGGGAIGSSSGGR
jgi:hypothetical protein